MSVFEGFGVFHEGITIIDGDERASLLEIGPADEDGVAMLRFREGVFTIEGIAQSKLPIRAAKATCDDRDHERGEERA